ncbi:MAG: AAA family ATPase [Sulfurimonas sp.]|jgi:DNA polymerase III delta prime subunit
MIESIFVRNITAGDFWNMERRPEQAPSGGGGQTYIDIPLGGIEFSGLAQFLGVSTETIEDHQSVNIMVNPIGHGTSSNITFAPRGTQNASRYRIINQNKHSEENNQRHSSWMVANGFPEMPENVNQSANIPTQLIENLKIYIVKTTEGNYYAGYVNQSAIPNYWPQVRALQTLFNVRSTAILHMTDLCDNSMVLEIINTWKHKPNVLLYGPPGTGKTHTMNALWKALRDEEDIECISLDSTNSNNPFVMESIPLPFERPVITSWVTFHQNYNYENFILSIKPVPNGATFQLEAHAGALLDAAIKIDSEMQAEYSELGENKAAIIFIDELNRGNVSRIFGEFITFMDSEYRKDINNSPIPVPLNNINNMTSIRTETIKLRDGSAVSLPIPWFFPKNVYILASMNSVDRAVAPLDSALSRRLHKINVFPNMDELAVHLNIENAYRLLTITESDDISEIKAEEVAWLLLYRINYELSLLMGRDYELGQSYLYSLQTIHNQDEKYKILAKIWDNLIFPQIQERFSNRSEEILRILRLNAMSPIRPTDQYLYKQKLKPLSNTHISQSPWTLNTVMFSKEFSANPENVKYSLRFLAGLNH